MTHLQVNDSQFQRFCGHCGQPIPLERLLKAITSRAKVFFCSDQHRFADANAKKRAARELRQANPNRLAWAGILVLDWCDGWQKSNHAH